MNKSRIAGSLAMLLVPGGGVIGCMAQEGTLRERIIQRQQKQPPPQATAGVGQKITKPGDYTFTIEHDGLQRSYMIHVPARYDPQQPAPLLVSLHGGGAFMAYQASDENYGQISKSDREGFIVAFPNGFSNLSSGKFATWNAGNCCGAARDENVDDVGFIRQMIQNLSGQLNIDRQRIFATGMSNGGLVAHRLACEMADTFRAIAPVADTDNTKSCNPSRPVSVLHIHAKNDDNMPFAGGLGKKSRAAQVTEFTSVPESMSRWVKRNACNPTPKRVLERPGAYCDRYAPCSGDSRVQLCVTDAGAHSWPGARKTRGEPASQAISANDVMWDFFMGR